MAVTDHPTNVQENLISHRETLQDHDSILNAKAAVCGTSGVLENIDTIQNATIPAMPNVAVGQLYWGNSSGYATPIPLFGLPRCVIHTMRSICIESWTEGGSPTTLGVEVGFDVAGHYGDWMQNSEIAKIAGQVLDSNTPPITVPGAAVVGAVGGTPSGGTQKGITKIMFLYLPY